jgi:hypothetical protein
MRTSSATNVGQTRTARSRQQTAIEASARVVSKAAVGSRSPASRSKNPDARAASKVAAKADSRISAER